jgi:transcriptional regulator with XRE-family HTH domain
MSSADKPLWNILRVRLAKATKGRGAKMALARLLGVSHAAISQWINGATKPSAEMTLRALEWVTAFEAKQQKSPGSALNTARGKTRPTRSKYETKTRIKTGRTKQ